MFLLNNNKKIFIFFTAIVMLLSVQNTKAQSLPIDARNTLYADFASRGAVYSVNYDRVFSQGKKISISFRAGISVLSNVVAVPLGIQFFTGKDASHIELSLTVEPYIEKYQDLFSGNNLSDKKMYIMPGTGYRYQQPGGGFFAKLVVGPIIYLDPPSNDFWNMDPVVYAGVTEGAGFSF